MNGGNDSRRRKGEMFKIGCRCSVVVSTKPLEWEKGTVRFAGKTGFDKTDKYWLGVELERAKGKVRIPLPRFFYHILTFQRNTE